MIINRWSDDIDAPVNNPIYIGYSGNPSKETWTMKDGTKILVGDMTDAHLKNCWKMVEGKSKFWEEVFKAETKKRVERWYK